MASQLPPDILHQIVECLYDDVVSLRSAMRVNKTWAEHAISILWEKPPVSALAAVTADRRQRYARQICELDFQGDRDGQKHAHFRALSFPRLRRVIIDLFRPCRDQKLWVGQYIQPALEDFTFYGVQPEEDILTRLESCVRLRKLVINYPIDGMNAARLLEFFEKRKSVTDIVLPALVSDVVNNQLVAYLARRPGLKTLELGRPLTHRDLTTALEGPHPFPNIVTLDLVVDSKAVAPLAEAVGSIRSLTLLIRDSDYGVLPPLGTLVELRLLDVALEGEMLVSAEDLLALRGLRHLESFKIYLPEDLGSHPLTDQDVTKMWAGWRRLKYLELYVNCSLSVAALIDLAEKCPGLVGCEMPGSFDLQAWSEIPLALFPNLKHFVIDAAHVGYFYEGPIMERAGKLVSLIIRHAPRLEELHLRDRTPLDKKVVSMFQKRTGQIYNA
ncbi:hypothetical protein BDW42DRAFT_197295 [Aspergillus taichungensis]|uniref:F-box domain-containing protein n=1 Tax=Aspergillus taichungensis TaxID=482145 RepID=A0A2J5HGX6_9EURO|nr:hypothetical protein BDW42DRAFT_197295 [Aspergillus taichungensis]